jgi:hypothetical protein
VELREGEAAVQPELGGGGSSILVVVVFPDVHGAVGGGRWRRVESGAAGDGRQQVDSGSPLIRHGKKGD